MNGSNASEIREMCKNGRYLQNIDAIMPVPHVALCVCPTATMNMIIANAHIYAYIPRITLACLRIDKYGDIVLLLIQLSHISVSADCKDYCYISRSSIMMVNVLLLMSSVIYTYIHVYISMYNICIVCIVHIICTYSSLFVSYFIYFIILLYNMHMDYIFYVYV